MLEYMDIVDNVLNNGTFKENRTGIRRLTTFCEIFRHNMSDGFPLVTTKSVPMRVVAVELEGFIKGIRSKKWFQDRKCFIWDEWCNPFLVDPPGFPNRNEQMLKEDDLGPIYGVQWRGKDLETSRVDQLKKVVDTLKSDPNDTRMVVTAWMPPAMDAMALPPCHYAFTLVHIDGTLNLSWKQRSVDVGLGLPFNIASYALLLKLLAREAGLKEGELVGVLEDCHIYENHIEALNKQQEREVRELPSLEITGDSTIFDWTSEEFELTNYNPHPRIKMDVAV